MAADVALSDVTTIRRALAQASLAPIDAQVLLAHVLGRDRTWLHAHATEPLAVADADAFFKLAARRRSGEPIAYLTGRREFWGLALAVDDSVLIPRPETETLVDCALRRLPIDRALRVLDLGTGSGAIAIALAHERPRASVVATDNSEAALEIARKNAEQLGLRNVEFVRSDWYETRTGALARPFSAIVSNPPYVRAGDRHLAEGDVRHEPPSALTSGRDGLDALRTIIGGAGRHLVPGGSLVVEHGYDQASAVRELLDQAGLTELECLRDLSGIPRVSAGRVR
jgi:release factor glutamine methyltransferase